MLSATIEQAMNEQINHEMSSAYVYLSMAAQLEHDNLPGMAQWLRLQAQEELAHAMKFYNEILHRGGRVRLQAIAGPPTDFASPQAIFGQGLVNEQTVTRLINRLYRLAVDENDYASQVFLAWFVTEQVEEEQNIGQIIETLKLIGDNAPALIMLDRELGQRQGGAE